jgi:hypothetical protein
MMRGQPVFGPKFEQGLPEYEVDLLKPSTRTFGVLVAEVTLMARLAKLIRIALFRSFVRC